MTVIETDRPKRKTAAAVSTLRLAITGMTCASCVSRVEKALSAVPGVASASVNLATERASVTAAGGVTAKQLVAAIERAGYDAAPIAEEETPAETGSDPGDEAELGLAIILTLPLLVPMAARLFGHDLMLSGWYQLLLATPVQFWVGRKFYLNAWKALRARAGNMDLLVALGASAGYGLSLALLLGASATMMPELYFEASAAVITLVRLGRFLEARAKRQTGSAIRALMRLRPETARVLRDGEESQLPIGQVRVGDLVLVRPGERIPVDGVISEGCASVDEAMITGESKPVDKRPGATVTGGAINLDGALTIETRAVGVETVLARMIRLVEHALAEKAPIQRLVDKISAIFVPVVLGLALATLIGWLAAGASGPDAIIAAVAVLVIACPCALGLATPTALISGMGVAARNGVLIRDPAALERASAVSLVAFDKTGTLTEGKPTVTEIEATDGNEARLLALAGALQLGSEHPLARAVCQALDARQLSTPAAAGFRALPGRGVEATVAGARYVLGNRALVPSLDLGRFAARAEALEQNGRTVAFLARLDPDPAVLGLIAFADQVKPGAAAAVAELARMGIESVMLTGDNPGAARRVAEAIGIADVRAGLLPEDKLAVIAGLRGEGRVIAMVGDGINDAPALAAADLGIALASGTDVAVNASGVTLMRGDPILVADALSIARRTQAKIRQNLFWAFVYNVIGIPLAALGLLNPMIAGAAMALSSVSVVSNALLLRRWRPIRR
jgi:Cu+-exporting ATPase